MHHPAAPSSTQQQPAAVCPMWLQSRRNTGHTAKVTGTQPLQTQHKSKVRHGNCGLSDVVPVAPVAEKQRTHHKSHGNPTTSDTAQEQNETRKLRFAHFGSRGLLRTHNGHATKVTGTKQLQTQHRNYVSAEAADCPMWFLKTKQSNTQHTEPTMTAFNSNNPSHSETTTTYAHGLTNRHQQPRMRYIINQKQTTNNAPCMPHTCTLNNTSCHKQTKPNTYKHKKQPTHHPTAHSHKTDITRLGL